MRSQYYVCVDLLIILEMLISLPLILCSKSSKYWNVVNPLHKDRNALHTCAICYALLKL